MERQHHKGRNLRGISLHPPRPDDLFDQGLIGFTVFRKNVQVLQGFMGLIRFIGSRV